MFLGLFLTITLLTCPSRAIVSEDPTPVIYSGQVNIGVLADLRVPGNGTRCGALRAEAVQKVMAAVWATHQVNFRKAANEFNLGVFIYDTCGREDVAQRQLIRLIEQVGQLPLPGCVDQRAPPVIGVIGQSDIQPLTIPAKILGAFSVPLVTTSESSPEIVSPLGNVFSTAPSSDAIARAIISILKHLRWNNVLMCSSGGRQRRRAIRFRHIAERIGLDVTEVPRQPGKNKGCRDVVAAAWNSKSHTKVTLLFMDNDDAIDTLRSVKPGDAKPPMVMVTPGDISGALQNGLSRLALQKLDNILLVCPVVPQVPEFDAFYREALKAKRASPSPLLAELSRTQNNTFKYNAVKDDVSATVQAVWTLALAIKDVQNRMCRPGMDCLRTMKKSLAAEVLLAAKNLKHTFVKSGAIALEGTGLSFGEDGFLASSRYSLKAPSAMGIIQEVAWYSDENGLILDDMVVASRDALQSTTTLNPFISQPSPSRLRSSSLSMANLPKTNDRELQLAVLEPTDIQEDITKVVLPDAGNSVSWFGKPWSLIILASCGIGILLTMYVSVFLMMKMCEGCIHRSNHVMVFLHLLAILMMFSGAILFLFQPSEFICGVQRMVHNLAFAFCFACILIKAMHLRATKLIGLGGRDSRLNQILSLIFSVGIQIAVEIQWLLLTSPNVVSLNGARQCSYSKINFLVSQSYSLFLLAMSAIVSFTTRNIPYSHREGQNLFITSMFCLPVFLAWSVAYGLVPDVESRSVVVSLGMTITGVALLGGIYGPMLYLIHKYGGLSHKPLSYADSLSTVFTMFKDVEPVVETVTPRGQKGAKTLDGRVSGDQDMVRNPLYISNCSAYP